METVVATTKEQMNVQIPTELKDLAKFCAAAQKKSLNGWIQNAIQEQIAREKKSLKLDQMHRELKTIAVKYLPGKVASKEQMLAMARRIAVEDTGEGFTVEPYAKPKVTVAKRAKARARR
jgi:uncharacterized protein (DUF1778 family)